MDPLYLRRLRIDRQIQQQMQNLNAGKSSAANIPPQENAKASEQLNNQANELVKNIKDDVMTPRRQKYNYIASMERSDYVKRMMNLPRTLPELLIQLQRPNYGKDIYNVLNEQIPSPDVYNPENENVLDENSRQGGNQRANTSDNKVLQPEYEGFEEVLQDEAKKQDVIMRDKVQQEGTNNATRTLEGRVSNTNPEISTMMPEPKLVVQIQDGKNPQAPQEGTNNPQKPDGGAQNPPPNTPANPNPQGPNQNPKPPEGNVNPNPPQNGQNPPNQPGGPNQGHNVPQPPLGPNNPPSPQGPHGPNLPFGPHQGPQQVPNPPLGPNPPFGPHGHQGPLGLNSPLGPHGPQGPIGPHDPHVPLGPLGPHGPHGQNSPHGPNNLFPPAPNMGPQPPGLRPNSPVPPVNLHEPPHPHDPHKAPELHNPNEPFRPNLHPEPHGPQGPHGPLGPNSPHDPHGPHGSHDPHSPHGPHDPHRHEHRHHIPEHTETVGEVKDSTINESKAALYTQLSMNDINNPTLTQMRQRLSDDAFELLFTGTLKLNELSEAIKHNGKDARSKLILAMANASKQGIDNTQLAGSLKMVSESMALEENNPASILKNIILLYLPWYPLQEGVGFKLAIDTMANTSDFSSLLKVFIQTRHFGNVNGSLMLLSPNNVDMNVQCDESFPKDDLLERMKEVTVNHTIQSNITVEQHMQMAQDVQNQQAKVNLSATYDLNPFLLLLAHSFIKNTIIIDGSANV